MDEQTARRRVAETNRLLYAQGLATNAGHVSVRDPETDVVYLNPFHVSRGRLTPEDVVAVDLDTTPRNPEAPDPVAEAAIHTAVYRARDDLHAVLHVHPPVATLFSITGTDLVPTFVRGAIFPGPVPVFDRPDTVTSREEGNAMVAAMDGQNQVLIRAHGAVVADRDVRWAFTRATYLEANADYQYRASLLGNPNPLRAEEVARIGERIWRERSVEKVWEDHRWRARQEGYLPETW